MFGSGLKFLNHIQINQSLGCELSLSCEVLHRSATYRYFKGRLASFEVVGTLARLYNTGFWVGTQTLSRLLKLPVPYGVWDRPRPHRHKMSWGGIQYISRQNKEELFIHRAAGSRTSKLPISHHPAKVAWLSRQPCQVQFSKQLRHFYADPRDKAWKKSLTWKLRV